MTSYRLCANLLFAATVSVLLVAPSARAQQAQVSDVMTKAVMVRDSLPPADGSLWRFEGPSGIQHGLHTGLGLDPFSGRINEVAIDPRNPLIMYATGATGGVWKTVDSGTTWTPRSAGFPIQSATAVALDPSSPSNVYVGTGDYKRADHSEPFSVGVMRSRDGGLTWKGSPVGKDPMRDYTVSRIVVDPVHKIVLAATGRGSKLPGGDIFRSSDDGITWVNAGLPDANWDDLELCDGATFWAAASQQKQLIDNPAGGGSGLLYRSTDGVQWKKIDLQAGHFNLDTQSPLKTYVACGAAKGSVFVGATNDAGDDVRVLQSNDAGANWTTVALVATGGGPFARSALAATQNFIFFGGTGLWKLKLSDTIRSFTPVSGVPSDIQCIVPDPTASDAVFVCDDKGIYRFDANTGDLKSLNSTLGVTQVWGMDVHPRNGNLIAIGEQDFGNSVSFFGQGSVAATINAASWGVVSANDGTNAGFKADGTSGVFTSNRHQVRPYNGETGPPLSHADTHSPVLFDPGGSNGPLIYRRDLDVLSVPNPAGLFKLTHPDTALVSAGPFAFGLAATGDRIISSVTCPTNLDLVYVGSERGEILRSIDKGEHWCTLGTAGTLPAAPIWAISPSPANCDDLLIGVGYEDAITNSAFRDIVLGNNVFGAGDRLFHKQNVNIPGAWPGAHGAGMVLPRAPVFSIARDSAAPGTDWFVATDVGVFRTHDGGNTWVNATAPLGLPNVPVRSLRLSADGNTLYAGTFGRSIWSMDVNPPANTFGVRGVVTQASRPLSVVSVTASGPGRIKRWLKNTLTTGAIATTAPIEIGADATISAARATVVATLAALSVSLVSPSGAVFPLAENPIAPGRFELLSAPGLIGRGTKGNWRFQLTGKSIVFNGITTRLIPQVQTANLELQFSGTVSTITDSNGEYTLEYLDAGAHVISVPLFILFGATTSISLNLLSNQTDVNFAAAPVGVASLTPKRTLVHVHDRFTYQLAYTITNNRSWRELDGVQLIFRDDNETVLALELDPTNGTFSEVRPNGRRGPAFQPGRPNRLETDAATVYLRNSQFVTDVPDASSFTANVALSFKPRADQRIFSVQLFATEKAGNSQGPYQMGALQVGDIPVPVLPLVDPEEEEQ